MKKICLIIFIVLGAQLNTLAPILNKGYKNNRFEQIVKGIEEEIAFNRRVELLLETIKLIESGGNYNIKGQSNEYGAYQFTKATYRMYSYLYFKELLPMTPENQDKIARKKVENLVKAGFSDSEIASFWNSGTPKWKGKIGINKYGIAYNVPKYVNKFNKALNKLKLDMKWQNIT